MLNAFACPQGRMQRLGASHDDEMLRRAVWIDLFNPSEEEIARVRRATGLRVPSEADLSEIESSSRLATRDEVLYLSLPLVSLADQAPMGVSAGFVLARDRLLTVHFASIRTFANFADRHCAGETVGETGAHIMVGLLEAIVDRQADALEQIRAELDTLSHGIFGMGVEAGGRKREDRILRATLGALGRIGDLISHIRETQVAVGRIGPYVETATKDWLPADLKPRLATLKGDIASVSDFDTHLNDKLQFLLDATLGFINIAQNNVMKVLTIASVAGIPPVLVAGIYGMNFKLMPEYDWTLGYPYSLALIFGSASISLLVFWWRGWI